MEECERFNTSSDHKLKNMQVKKTKKKKHIFSLICFYELSAPEVLNKSRDGVGCITFSTSPDHAVTFGRGRSHSEGKIPAEKN